MSSTNLEERDLGWALKTFRPLLKELKLQEVKAEARTVFTSSFKNLIRYNMANCIVVVKTKKFTNKDDRGLFIWQYNEETNMYALYIFLNESLYASDETELRIKRKAAGVHEFTHCVAAMLMFSRLQSKVLIEIVHKRMTNSIHSLDKFALENLYKELTMSSCDSNSEMVSFFPDEHFRILGEDFSGSYEELNRNFLLSYELFCETPYFDKEKQTKFKALLNKDEKNDAVAILIAVTNTLAEDKALSKHFVSQRISEEFLTKILK